MKNLDTLYYCFGFTTNEYLPRISFLILQWLLNLRVTPTGRPRAFAIDSASIANVSSFSGVFELTVHNDKIWISAAIASTAPTMDSGSASPISAMDARSQYCAEYSFFTRTNHLPPFLFTSSSHSPRMPFLKRWYSMFSLMQSGRLMWAKYHQKSSTVEKDPIGWIVSP